MFAVRRRCRIFTGCGGNVAAVRSMRSPFLGDARRTSGGTGWILHPFPDGVAARSLMGRSRTNVANSFENRMHLPGSCQNTISPSTINNIYIKRDYFKPKQLLDVEKFNEHQVGS